MGIELIIGTIVGLLVLWVASLVLFFVLRPKDVPVRELLAVIPDVLRLLRSLIRDGAVPADVRLVVIGLIAWILSPIDLIPEFIPVLGPLDDVVVAIVAMRYVRRRVGIADLEARWQGTPDGFALLTRVIGAGTAI
jgi:uncharacterized membrane protein YkvA (DUF1232 family)